MASIHIDDSIGVIVVVGNRRYQRSDFSRLRLAIADGIVGVMVIITVGVVSFGQVLQGIVDVVNCHRAVLLKWCKGRRLSSCPLQECFAKMTVA